VSSNFEPDDVLETLAQSAEADTPLMLTTFWCVMLLQNSDSTIGFNLQQFQLKPFHHATRVASFTINVKIIPFASVRVEGDYF